MSLTPQQDDRLADAFEVCQDLQLSETPADALKMVLDLLRRTVPCEAITTALYDINTDEFRFVALDGPGAEQLRGKAISPSEGLIAAAAGAIGTAMLIEDVSVDDRYRAALDGRPGLEPRTMMLLGVGHERRLLGMIQLINRVEQAQFSRADAHVVTYIGKQLGEYLHTMRSNFTRPNTSIRPGR